MAQRIVDVLVPVALDHAYSYRAPPELDLHVGDIGIGETARTTGVVLLARCGLGEAIDRAQTFLRKHNHDVVVGT